MNKKYLNKLFKMVIYLIITRIASVILGEKRCQTPGEFKAWSQSLGHEGVLTTFYSYGDVVDYRQDELFKKLIKPRTEQSPEMQIAFEMMFNKMMNK